MLVGEEMTATAHSTLHFIKDEQGAVLITKLSCSLQEFLVCWQDTAFPLDRLDHDCTRLFRDSCSQSITVVVGHMVDSSRLGAKSLCILGLSADGHSE